MDEVHQILQKRPTTHGPFHVVARIAQDTKAVWKGAEGWEKLDMAQREALEMVAHKVARILAGDPAVREHWVDGAGYFFCGIAEKLPQ